MNARLLTFLLLLLMPAHQTLSSVAIARDEMIRRNRLPGPDGIPIELRGANKELQDYKGHEVILAGARDTGKSVACCVHAHLNLLKYPGCQGVMARELYNSLVGTVVMTYETVSAGYGVKRHGGDKPYKFTYPNGSCLWLAGLDNPGSSLSSERDFVYVNQAEELKLTSWETLSACCSGRAKHGEALAQIFGDCNPGGSKHWILTRAREKGLKLLTALHEDNPTIFNRDGTIKEAGKPRIAVLDGYTGVALQRMRFGRWVSAEGAVYDMFDSSIGNPVHVRRREVREMKRFMLAMDWGYTHPAVICLIGEDGDGRWHQFMEYYKSGMPQEHVVSIAASWWNDPVGSITGIPTPMSARNPSTKCQRCASDEANPELIARLNASGVRAEAGKGLILDGIWKLQRRMAVAGDGKPRMTIDPSCSNTINDFESYRWRLDRPKDEPEKENDHAPDAWRYLEDIISGAKPPRLESFVAGTGIWAQVSTGRREREVIG